MNDWFDSSFVGEFSEWHVANLPARRDRHAREYGGGGGADPEVKLRLSPQSSDLYGFAGSTLSNDLWPTCLQDLRHALEAKGQAR